jgi:hypothetical protein
MRESSIPRCFVDTWSGLVRVGGGRTQHVLIIPHQNIQRVPIGQEKKHGRTPQPVCKWSDGSTLCITNGHNYNSCVQKFWHQGHENAMIAPA